MVNTHSIRVAYEMHRMTHTAVFTFKYTGAPQSCLDTPVVHLSSCMHHVQPALVALMLVCYINVSPLLVLVATAE